MGSVIPRGSGPQLQVRVPSAPCHLTEITYLFRLPLASFCHCHAESALPNCRLFRIRLWFVDDQVRFPQAVVISSLSVAVVIMVGRGGSWKGSSSLESK